MQRLPMLGEVRAEGGGDVPAVAAKGFRPFFLMAGVFATAVLPLWIAALVGRFDPGGYLGAMYWHAHEMVFGFATAVLAGFLLTAVGNWTQRETATGAPLMALCALWLAGRVAMLTAVALPRGVAAAVDLAFLPVLAVVLARPIVAAKNHRNLVMLAVVTGLWLCDLSVHLDALGVITGWRRRGSLVGVDLLVVVMLLMAGRVFPMFTRNATRVDAIHGVPALDVAAVVGMAAVTALDAAAPDARVTAVVAGVTAALTLARMVHWGTRHTARNPMLWVLHAGHLWIVAGLALRAAAAVTTRVPSPVATHAFTVGALGALTLGMMVRVSLGHTGRLITATRASTAAFALVTLAALVRVVTPLAHLAWYRASVFVAGALWTVAFALFVAVVAPVVTSPRVDGKAG